MPHRVRRHTIHTLAVLSVLQGERKRTFTASEVAERVELSYGSVYSVLQRLFASACISRYENHGEAVGHSRVSYQIEPRGSRVVRRIHGVGLGDPAALMRAWTAEDAER